MATITYTVTVATGTNQYSASANKFYINGEVSPVLELQEGNTYIFDQSDSTNGTGGGHPLRFSATANGTWGTAPGGGAGVEYTTGVTTTWNSRKCWCLYSNCCCSSTNCRRSSFILLLF